MRNRHDPFRWASFAASVLSTLAVQGCATAQPVSGAPAGEDPLAPLWREVTVQVGDAGCDNDSQCRVVGVGAKACGGPSGYLAWSTRRTQEAALLSAVERHARAQREAQQRAGMASNCAVTPQPGTQCRPRADGVKVCQIVRAEAMP